MNDNTFWTVFWVLILSYFSFGAFMDYKSAQIKQEARVEIYKLRMEQDLLLRESLEKMTNDISNIQRINNAKNN